MKGRSTFSRDEIEILRRLLREKATADRDRQKILRNRMRSTDFYISDFSDDPAGFTEADLDKLLANGTVTIQDPDG